MAKSKQPKKSNRVEDYLDCFGPSLIQKEKKKKARPRKYKTTSSKEH